MNKETIPAHIYTSRINACKEQLRLLRITKDRIAWARLVNILLIAAAAYYIYPVGFLFTAIAVIALSAIFIRLIILAVNNKTAIENTNRLIEINQQELDIAAGHYTNLPSGLVPAPAIHDI